jgi:hypothetical protein
MTRATGAGYGEWRGSIRLVMRPPLILIPERSWLAHGIAFPARLSNTGSVTSTVIDLLWKQDQSEWQIEWQIVLARACPGLASAGARSRSSWSSWMTSSCITARWFMVRRRSTVRFRKGAPSMWSFFERATGYLPLRKVPFEWHSRRCPAWLSRGFLRRWKRPSVSRGSRPGRWCMRKPPRDRFLFKHQ